MVAKRVARIQKPIISSVENRPGGPGCFPGNGRFQPKHGATQMQFCWKTIIACLATVAVMAAAGCGGDDQGKDPTPAAIPGADQEKGKPGTHSIAPVKRSPEKDPLHPVVLIDTSLGRITMELDAEKAPLTVDNFLSYVDKGEYDQTIFHQVIQDYPKVVIAGAYTADLTEKPSQTSVRNEARNGLKNRRGTVAMARQADVIDSATRYFFFNLTDNEVLDYQDPISEKYGYCVFGKVTEGMDVVEKIGAVDVHDTEKFERIPVRTVMIQSIRQVK